jgi:hypothetical protein
MGWRPTSVNLRMSKNIGYTLRVKSGQRRVNVPTYEFAPFYTAMVKVLRHRDESGNKLEQK